MPRTHDATHPLLESLKAAVALVGHEGQILEVNAAWQAFPPGHPLVGGMGPGMNYRQVCEAAKASPLGDISLVAMGLLGVLEGRVPRISLDYPLELEGERHFFGTMAFHPTGHPEVGAIIHHTDTSDRTRLERRLRKSEALFKSITDHSLDLIAMLDPKGRFTYLSPAYTKLLGVSAADLTREPIQSRVHPEDLASFEATLVQAKKRGLGPFVEFRLRKDNGDWLPLEGRATAVDQEFEGQEVLLLLCRDITERRQAAREQARLEVQLRHGQKMEAVGQLAAGIAHEINTPIQFISDNVRFLQEAWEGARRVLADLQSRVAASEDLDLKALGERYEQEEIGYFLDEVPPALLQTMDGLGRITKIVQAMKVFSHPSTEQATTVDVNQAVETTLTVAANEWKYVAEVEKHLDPNLPPILGYPGELNQVLLNLLVNAAHALGGQGQGPKGTIRLSTRQAGDEVEFTIADSGCGIPPTILGRIFEPFFTTKPVGKGTGQGLSVVQALMDKHGGTVAVESELGKGTQFTLRFPLKKGRE